MIVKFFTLHGFIFEILLASALFVKAFKPKKHFLLRLVLLFFGMLAFSAMFTSFFEASIVSNIIRHSTLYFFTIVGVMLCFKVNFYLALFAQIGAYATQHCAFKIASTLQIMLKGHLSVASAFIIYLFCIVVIYTLSYIFFASAMDRNEEDFVENRSVIWLGIAILMFATAFQATIEVYYLNLAKEVILISGLYDIFCSIFTLSILNGMFKSGKLKQDNKLMEHLIHLQQEQFKESKQNIERINVKCHDLKHQISQLSGRISKDEIDEMNKLISIYDLSIKTGNEVLDVIFAEKSLLCEGNKIHLSVIADGSKLSFLRHPDTYALFGNAIDNAIEATIAIKEVEKRIINISISEVVGVLSIHISNNYEGDLKFFGELPQTTKDDKLHHGFGMRSMQMIVEKYGGNISISHQNNKFTLNILFPL